MATLGNEYKPRSLLKPSLIPIPSLYQVLLIGLAPETLSHVTVSVQMYLPLFLQHFF